METFFRKTVDLQNLYNSSTNSLTTGDAHYFEDLITPSKIKQYLDSAQEPDKLKGMKLLLAMISKGKDIPEFFPDVVKNVVVKSIEVKKMVYIYLDFDANCREIALLSINSFQKDMSDSNQLIRGLALRVMTSVRVEDIIQIQLLAIRKCATDSSPYVRKCAANAIAKVYYMDPSQLEQLKTLIETLLKDNSTMVLGSTVAAFNEVCPTSYHLLHSNYRKLCHLLADMDEWTQVSILEVMTRYVRNQFTDPAPELMATIRLRSKQRSNSAMKLKSHSMNSSSSTNSSIDQQQQHSSGGILTGIKSKSRVIKKAFYSDDEDESEDEKEYHTNSNSEFGSVYINSDVDYDSNLDPDHKLILKSSLPLLKSRNAGVVLGVSILHYYCGTQSNKVLHQVGKALIRILRNRREIQYVVLNCIRSMSKERPDMFRSYLRDFFMKSADPILIKLIKLDILASLSDDMNIPLLLKELQIYIGDQNEKFVSHTVITIGRIADAASDTNIATSCMEGIIQLLIYHKNTAMIVCECATVLRQLFQQNPQFQGNGTILRQLVKLLVMEENGITEASARASIVWLVGEFYSLVSDVAPDVLRLLAISFNEEATEVKMQVLNLAIKLSLLLPEDANVQVLATYILELSRYDIETDIRDRSRIMTALMGLAPTPTAVSDSANTNIISAEEEDALALLSDHAAGIVLPRKLPPITLNSSYMEQVEGDTSSFMLGSLSSIVAHSVIGYEPMSKWADVAADSSKRDSTAVVSDGFTYVTKGIDRKAVDLSDFYKGESDYKRNVNNNDDSSSSSSSSEDSSSSDDSEEGDSEESASAETTDSSENTSSDEDSDSDDTTSEKNNRYTTNKSTAQRTSMVAMKSISLAKTVKNKTVNSPIISQQGTPAISQTLSNYNDDSQTVRSKSIMKKVVGNNSRNKSQTHSQQLLSSSSGGHSSGFDLLSINDSASASGHNIHPIDIFSNNPSNIPLIPNNLTTNYLPSDNSNLISLMDGSNESISVLDNNTTNLSPSQIMQRPMLLTNNNPNINNNMMMNSNAYINNNMMMNSNANINNNMTMMTMSGSPRLMLGSTSNPTSLSINPTQATMNPAIAATIPPTMQANTLPPNEYLSAPKQILRPEMGGGLDISLVFRRNTSISTLQTIDVNMFQVYLVVKNCRDHNIRRIRISFPAMDQMHRATLVPEIPLLPGINNNTAPNNQIILPIELVLSYTNVCKQFKVDVRSDLGSFIGNLSLEDWDFMKPFILSTIEFETQRSLLGGFGEHSRSYPTSTIITTTTTIAIAGGDLIKNNNIENELLLKVQCALNVSVIQGVGYGQLMFAGIIKKGIIESKVYLTILSDRNEVKVRFNCEDPVFCSKLSDGFLKLLLSS